MSGHIRMVARKITGRAGILVALTCAALPVSAEPAFLRSKLVADRFLDPRANPVIADLDGDGLKDIVWTDSETIGWIRNLGNRQFGPKTVLEQRENWNELITKVVVADMDGDQKPDIVYDANSADLHIMYNEGNGRFSPGRKWYYGVYYGYGHTVEDFVVGDFDQDGDNDIVVSSNYTGRIYLQINVGGFWSEENDTWVFSFDQPYRQRCIFWTEPTAFPEPDDPIRVADARYADFLVKCDVNGDEWPDICFSSRKESGYTEDQTIEAIINPGEEPFENDVLYPENITKYIGYVAIYANQLLAVDLDGEPGDEFISSSWYNRGLTAWLRPYLNPDELIFWDPTRIVERPENVFRWDTGDIDGDGDMDVVCLVDDPDQPNVDGPLRLSAVTNHGVKGVEFNRNVFDSEFHVLDAYTPTRFGRFLTVGDLDNDNLADILLLKHSDEDCARNYGFDVYFNSMGSGDTLSPRIWPDAEFIEANSTGWWWSGSFGHYKTYCSGNWFYQPSLGFAHAVGGSSEGQWFWTPDRGWFWTSSTAWPAYFSASASGWVL